MRVGERARLWLGARLLVRAVWAQAWAVADWMEERGPDAQPDAAFTSGDADAAGQIGAADRQLMAVTERVYSCMCTPLLLGVQLVCVCFWARGFVVRFDREVRDLMRPPA